MSSKSLAQIRELCESDLYSFAQYVFPDRYYGDVHKELFRWFQEEESDFQLALIPRDHQKSHCIAVYCAWKLTIKPWWTFLYVSSNPGLAKEQLDVVEQILKSDRYRAIWPEMLNYVKDRDGSMKHKPLYGWTQDAIRVDHPERRKRQVRDPSIRATSAKSGKTGYHCNEVIFDDLVTDENYGSQAEQDEVIKCYKNCMKIMTTNSKAKAVGTRYGEDDLYALMSELSIPIYEDGIEVGEEKLWSIFERVVEDSPNRTGDGNFLWPRTFIPSLNEWFGFDQRELAIKKRNLTIDGDLSSFYAQYYNDPNDKALQRISRNNFEYIEPKHLTKDDFSWYYAGEKLRLVAAMDLAFSAAGKKRRDYTAIAVVGMDKDGFIYILDIDRFQTEKYEVFYERLIQMYAQWGFKELYVETNNGGGLVADFIKSQVRREGGSLEVKGEPAPNDRSKQERTIQILEPRYRSGSVRHNKIGLIRVLEEELMQPRPKNDDVKDAVTLAVSKLRPPLGYGTTVNKKPLIQHLSRYGGRRGGARR